MEEELCLKSTTFWDITPCSPLKVNRHFGGTCRLHHQGRRISQTRNQLCLPPAFTLVSCLAYTLTLKMEATCSLETSVDFQRTTWCYIPEDSTLHNHRCENLKSYKEPCLFNEIFDMAVSVPVVF
jgi:hypothetical protein